MCPIIMTWIVNIIDYTGTDNVHHWHVQDHKRHHLHPSPALGDGQDGLWGIPGHPPMEGISARLFLIYNYTTCTHQWTGPRPVISNSLSWRAGRGDVLR